MATGCRSSNYYNYNNCFTASWTVSGTTWVSRYQKGKTRKVKPIWIYTAKDSEWQWHQLGHMQICKSSNIMMKYDYMEREKRNFYN